MKRSPEARHQMDDGPWDRFVAAHPNGHFLQSSAWAAVRRRQGWSVERTVLCGGAGEPVAGAQILLQHRFGGTIAYAPRGPVARPDDGTWHPLLAALRDRYRRRAVVLRLEPHWTDGPTERAALSTHGLVEVAPVQPPSTLVLDLAAGPAALLAAMKPKWRYNIRLAERQGVVAGLGSAADLDAFEDLLHATAVRHGLGERSRGYHAAVAAAFGPAARLWIARASGRPLAAALVVHHGPTATYLYGASSEADRQRMPSHAVQWAAIADACAHGLARYDMWGVPDEIGRAWAAGDDPDAVPEGTGGLWGVWRFKRGFGGAVWRAVGTWDDVFAPIRYHAARRIAAVRRTP